MSCNSKSYVPKKLRKLGMLWHVIPSPVETIPQKLRRIIQPFEEALDLAVGNSMKVSKPNDESLLAQGEYDCPALLVVL